MKKSKDRKKDDFSEWTGEYLDEIIMNIRFEVKIYWTEPVSKSLSGNVDLKVISSLISNSLSLIEFREPNA